MIILNEKEFAEHCIRDNDVGDNPYYTISVLAKYYYHTQGFRRKKIEKMLSSFLEKAYPPYITNQRSWQSSIESLSAGAKYKTLYEITGVPITQDEMQTIRGLNNRTLERIAFTMLCLAKYGNMKNPKNNGWVNFDAKEIYKLSHVTSRAYDRDVKIGMLWERGLIEFSNRIDNLNCRVTFINNNDDKIALVVSDFRELGYEYLRYCGDDLYIRCAECGVLIRGMKNGEQKYCKKCAASTVGAKTITCIDCGAIVRVSNKNHKTIRCSDCQRIKDREIKRRWKTERA